MRSSEMSSPVHLAHIQGRVQPVQLYAVATRPDAVLEASSEHTYVPSLDGEMVAVFALTA